MNVHAFLSGIALGQATQHIRFWDSSGSVGEGLNLSYLLVIFVLPSLPGSL